MITWLDAWRGIGNRFADQSAAILTIALHLAIALVAGLAAFPGIRRVVP